MPYSHILTVPGQDSPTLWPLLPNERTPLEFAVEVCEKENKELKALVVSLSEIILRAAIGKN